VNNHKVLLSLGSNIGDRKEYLQKVINYCTIYNILSNIKLSNIYETEPFGEKEQAYFLNMCISGLTSLSALSLIDTLKNLEIEMGRIDRGKWKAREIDIDILLYEDIELNNEKLELPHPRMHQRKFVLVPANEIESDMIHPILNKTLKELLIECNDESDLKIFEYNIERVL
jgi:2-amino-4-hydroxy-6-hydroxymethyldihydropteridine diphosphokinase